MTISLLGAGSAANWRTSTSGTYRHIAVCSTRPARSAMRRGTSRWSSAPRFQRPAHISDGVPSLRRCAAPAWGLPSRRRATVGLRRSTKPRAPFTTRSSLRRSPAATPGGVVLASQLWHHSPDHLPDNLDPDFLEHKTPASHKTSARSRQGVLSQVVDKRAAAGRSTSSTSGTCTG